MILCVNPNAAIDKTVVVEDFHLNAIHRPSFELALPGGKGCNVARVARALGRQPVVTGWVGGHAGHFIEDGLQAEGILTAFVHTAVESRTCLSVLDPMQGTMTEIYEKGRPVSEADLESFYANFREWLPKVRLVTLSGSLPPGVPACFYAELIQMARAAGVRVLLDSSGEPLLAGFQQGRPYMLKCNRAEISGLVGRSLDQLEELKRVAVDISSQQDAWVVITLGEAGAVAAGEGRAWLAQSPRIEAVSAVGSGDAFLAGLACGLLDELPFEDTLRLALAAGAANTLLVGAGRLRAEDVQSLVAEARVVEVPVA
jgi:tagatose 6-phosphate kinase